jgi:hypothetical protein
VLTDQIISGLRTRLLSVADVWGSRLDLWYFIAEEAGLDARSVYNFATSKPKMHNPRLSTLNGLEKAISKAEELVGIVSRDPAPQASR